MLVIVTWHSDISLLVAVGYIHVDWCGLMGVTCIHWLRVVFMQVRLVCSVFIVLFVFFLIYTFRETVCVSVFR